MAADTLQRMADAGRPRFDRYAVRLFVTPGLAARCEANHPILDPAVDHFSLFMFLDWPGRDGLPAGLRHARAAASRGDHDAALQGRLAASELALVRATSRAGERIGCEDLETGRAFMLRVPLSCTLPAGGIMVSRFVEVEPEAWVPIADLLVVEPDQVDDVLAARDDRCAPRGPSPRATDAIRLFRAWSSVCLERGEGDDDWPDDWPDDGPDDGPEDLADEGDGVGDRRGPARGSASPSAAAPAAPDRAP